MEQEAKCPHCGATLRGPICDFCGSVIDGFTESQTYNEYRTKKSKRAKLGFFSTIFPLVFALGFGAVPFSLFALDDVADYESRTVMILMAVIFGTIGLVALGIFLYSIGKRICIIIGGQEYIATVSGYSKSNYTLNDNSVYSVKLLMNVDGDYYYIYLDTGSVEKRYVIGDRVTVKKYKDIYLLEE